MAITQTTVDRSEQDDPLLVWAELAGGVAGHWITVEQMLAGRVVFDDVPAGWYPYLRVDQWTLNIEGKEGVTLNESGHRVTIDYKVVA